MHPHNSRGRRAFAASGLALIMFSGGGAYGAQDASAATPTLTRSPFAGAKPALERLAAPESARARRRAARLDRLVFPIAGRVDYGTAINRFGVARPGHTHGGQDVFARAGTPLRAVRNTTVTEVGSDGGRGNFIVLWNQQARRSYHYFHMISPSRLRVGQRVRAGQRIGSVGCSGSCQGDHLHFEVRLGRNANARAVDPMPLLRRAS